MFSEAITLALLEEARTPFRKFSEASTLSQGIDATLVRAARKRTTSYVSHFSGFLVPADDSTAEAASWSKAGFLIANLIVGSGIFTTPYGFVLAGWFGAVLAILATGAALWTALLLGDLLEVVATVSPEAPPTYNTIGELAFGRGFLPFFGAFCIGQCLLQGVYIINLSAQSWQVSLSFPAKTMIWVNALACLCITLMPRRYLGIIAKAGVALTFGAVSVVVASGLALLPDNVDTNQSLFGQGIAGVSGSLATVILSCGDHVCFPEVYNMTGRNRKTYKKGAGMAFGIFLSCALAFCIPFYMTMGVTIQPNVLTSIGLGVDGKATTFPSWLRSATNAVLAFRFLFLVPCFMPCIFAALDSATSIATKIDLSDIADEETIFVFLYTDPIKFSLCLVNRIFGYCILAFCATFFESVVGALVTIVGSLFQSVNVIIIPCLAYYKLCHDQLKGNILNRLLLWVMVLVGSIWCVGGTMTGIIGVVKGRASSP